jgi:MoxR-like ATPase
VHEDVQTIQASFAARGYVAGRELATGIFLARELGRPMLIEGPAGVGKTEVAKVMAQVSGRELIRLQCYEGLDTQSALYEWNYQKQLLAIRMQEARQETLEHKGQQIFSEAFLLKRPLLAAITAEQAPVLLIDEVDRADEAFEAFLLELLSDWQVSIPELGTLRARAVPATILTSNRTRELSDALRRRCLYLWIDYPDFETELAILRRRLPELSAQLAERIVAMVQLIRRLPLEKTPGVAESVDWAAALMLLHREALDEALLAESAGVLLKHYDDQKRYRSRWLPALVSAFAGVAPGSEALQLERLWQQLESALR